MALLWQLVQIQSLITLYLAPVPLEKTLNMDHAKYCRYRITQEKNWRISSENPTLNKGYKLAVMYTAVYLVRMRKVGRCLPEGSLEIQLHFPAKLCMWPAIYNSCTIQCFFLYFKKTGSAWPTFHYWGIDCLAQHIEKLYRLTII